MDSTSRPATSRSRLSLHPVAILLSTVGGAVDAIGFLLLFHMFVAHMSGNSAAFGAYLGQGEWAMAFNHLFPIPLFVLGIVAGTVLNEILANGGVRSPFACVAGLEAFLLILFMVLSSAVYSGDALYTDSGFVFYSSAALLVLAMGLQNATLQRAGGADLHTTYVTGTLNALARELVRYVQWLRAQDRHASGGFLLLLQSSRGEPSYHGMILSGSMWMFYVVGASVGSLAKHLWDLGALVLPLLVLAAVVLVDLVRPIELERPGTEDRGP